MRCGARARMRPRDILNVTEKAGPRLMAARLFPSRWAACCVRALFAALLARVSFGQRESIIALSLRLADRLRLLIRIRGKIVRDAAGARAKDYVLATAHLIYGWDALRTRLKLLLPEKFSRVFVICMGREIRTCAHEDQSAGCNHGPSSGPVAARILDALRRERWNHPEWNPELDRAFVQVVSRERRPRRPDCRQPIGCIHGAVTRPILCSRRLGTRN